jgi:anti-sigma factor RsiW
MIPHPTLHWNEILAAYADGEFEGRDDLALLKQRVENWLTTNPEARAELATIRQLKQAWHDTVPPSPDSQVWAPMLAALECMPRRTTGVRASWRRTVGIASAVAATIALAFTIWWSQRTITEPAHASIAAEDLPFSVAQAHEVEILNVDGADTHTLVVGELPLNGSLELAGLGDVTVNSVQPAARDNMLPDVHVRGPGRPMIWARLDTD